MKKIDRCQLVIAALAVTLCFALLLGMAEPAFAASDTFAASSPILFADGYFQIIGNRSRMIQLSVVAVVFSCALLWWKR